jgi:hypothetical protein
MIVIAYNAFIEPAVEQRQTAAIQSSLPQSSFTVDHSCFGDWAILKD